MELLATVAVRLVIAATRNMAHPKARKVRRCAIQLQYMRFIKGQGYTARITHDEIVIERGGKLYWLILSDNAVCLVNPEVLTVRSELERRRAVHAAMHVTAKSIVAKAYLTGASVAIGVEVFAPDAFTDVFMDAVKAIERAAEMFSDRMARPDVSARTWGYA